MNTTYSGNTYYCIILEYENKTAYSYSYNIISNTLQKSVETSLNILPMYKYIQNDVYYVTTSSHIFNYGQQTITNLACANTIPTITSS